MPQSSHRHKHHAHSAPHPKPPAAGTKSKRSAALLMAIFIGVVGLAIGALASGMNFLWMAGSTALGIVGGALIGRGIDRSIDKK